MSNFIVSASDLATFNIADFQTEIGDEPDPSRFYLEFLAMTNEVNSNFVEVTDEALEMMAAGYKTGLPLTINHMKGLFDTSLGIGQTVDAFVNQGKLYLQMYIAKNKTYNLATIGNSEELIDAVKDGYVRRGSTSIKIKEAECSVCSSTIEKYWGCEDHPKGQKTIIQNDNGVDEVVVPHIRVLKAEAIEFSISMLRADEKSEVMRKNMNFYMDNVINAEIFNDNFIGKVTQEPHNPLPKKEIDMTDQEKQVLEAERDAEKRKADALQISVDSLNAQLEQANSTITDLKERVAENTVLIQDGKDARKTFEDAYIEEFTAYMGKGCDQETQDAQRELIKDFNISTLKMKTESMKDHNKREYESGRRLTDDEPDTDTNDSHIVIPD